MGGHEDVKLPKVPDWRIYKVEDVKELMQVKKSLASIGLKDPWLRNEVWKYTEFEYKVPSKKAFTKILFCGFKYGLIAAVACTVAEKIILGLTRHDNDDDSHH